MITYRRGRAYAHYANLEETKAGMWRRVSDADERDELLSLAVRLLRDVPTFEASMRRALAEWPVSCEVAFTNPSLNKPVWLAHAGASLTHSVPEEFMRLGFWELDASGRVLANDAAARCAKEWVPLRQGGLF